MEKSRPCIISCSVLKDEIEKLIQQGDLDAKLLLVSKYFHVEFSLIEKHLRPVIERAQKCYPGNVILVYGDLCLGMDNEMKKLAEEYGIIKIDALNCIDCQLGGKGKFLQIDPNHEVLFLSPGMTDFFGHAQELMEKEGLDKTSLRQFFSGLKGIVILDTLGNADELKAKVERLDTGLDVLEIKHVGCQNVKKIIKDAIKRNRDLRAFKKSP